MEQKKIPSLFGTRLKQLREQRGITQSELAVCLDVTQQTVASWECGRTEPNITAIMTMSDIFEVGVQTMFSIGEKSTAEAESPEFIVLQRNAGKMTDAQFRKMYSLLKLSFDEFDWETKATRKSKNK